MKHTYTTNSPKIDKLPFAFEQPTKGSLIIPDISGFTRFVRNTDMDTGRYVISRLNPIAGF